MRQFGKSKLEPLMNSAEAAEYMRVNKDTLNGWVREGHLSPYQTPGGHRRYSVEMLNAYLEGSKGAEFGKRGR